MSNNNPRIIEAKFNSKCAETGKEIRKGEQCLYFPTAKKVYSLDSNEAYQWRMNQQDEQFANN